MSAPERSGGRGALTQAPPANQEIGEPATTVPPAALDGRVGRYRLCYELARGGMATVYLARMMAGDGFGKVVALKCIHPHLAAQPEFVQMFLDEARLASRITHPNVCSIVDFGNEQGTYYLALEFLLGEPLGRLLGRLQKTKRRSTEERVRLALYIIAQAAEGLHAAHEVRNDEGTLMNVVHRDVSPQNLFVTYQGGVSVLDFGVASAEGRLHETEAGQIKGKFAYMAPEQLGGNADRRSDVWSLGICLWELLTVRKLFNQKTPAELVRAATLDPIAVPSAVCKDLPKGLDGLVMKALSRDPETRYQTAREFGLALTRYARDHKGQVGMVELAECMDDLFSVERGRKEQLVDLTRRGDEAGGVVNAGAGLWQTQKGTPPVNTLTIGPGTANETVEQLAAELDRLRADVSNRRRRSLWLIAAPALLVIVAAGIAAYTGLPEQENAIESPPPTGSQVSAQDAPRETGPAEPSVESGDDGRAEPSTATGQEATATNPPRVEEPLEPRSPAREPVPARTTAARRPAARSSAASSARRRPAKRPAAEASLPAREAERAEPRARTLEVEPAIPADLDRRRPTTAPPAIAEPARAPLAPPDEAPRATVTPAPSPSRPASPPAEARPRPPPVLDATVALAGASVARGTLPSAEVSRAASRALDAYRACYRSAARRAGRDAGGTLTLRFEIDTRGRFREVRPSSGPLPGLGGCVAQASTGLRTRRAPDTGSAQATLQVRFAVRRR